MTWIPLMVALATAAPAQPAPTPQPAAITAADDNAGIPGLPPGPPPAADQVQELAYHIGLKLRCPVCQGLSVADSSAETAVGMQRRIRELVALGYDEDQIRDYFVDRYGEWILLDPEPEGLNLIIWIGPGLMVGLGLAWAAMTVMTWRREEDDVPLPSDVGAVAKDRYEQRLLAELEEEQVEIDWAVWGPPLAIVVVGAAVGFFAATRLKSEDEGVTEEGRRIDLETTREEMLEALRVLELDKVKLTPDEYERERESLLARGAGAMRELDGGGDIPAGADESPAAARPAAAAATAGGAPAPVGGLAPEWKGALYALGAVAVIGLLVWFAQNSAVDRRDGASMTGNQDLGDGSMQADEGPPPMSDAVKARIAELEANIQADAADLVSINEITRLYLNHGDPGSAMQWNQQAMELTPTDPEARTYKAVLAAMVGLMDQALAGLDQVLAEHPEQARALTYKGLILMQINRAAEAVPVLEKAVALQPDNPILPQALAQAKQMAGMGGGMPPAMGGSAIVSGTATLGEGASVTGSELVFVSVRDPSQPGPPLAAKKLPASFPLSFSLTDADIMAMGGAPRPIPPTFEVTIRVDTDGNAMTRDAGAPSATLTGVSKGLAGVSVALTPEGTVVDDPTGTVAAPAPASAARAGEVIVKGTAVLDSSAAGRVTGTEMVYISIKGPGGGPPLAAFKHQGASFPVEFQLTTADKIPMAGDRPIPDQVQLSIRVDADGNAFTKEEGAPAAVIEGVARGSTDLTVTLK